MDKESKGKQDRKSSIAFWISMLRGFFAIILGLILIFNPEKSRVMLFNFMGLFWLTSGIILLRHANVALGEQSDRMLGRRTTLALGLIAILTGLLVISRSLTRDLVGEVVFFELLGGVILLTGVLHLFGEFRIGRVLKGKRTTAQKILAIFEIVLGAMLIISPLDQGPIVYWAATIWALVGGGLIIADALRQRARASQEPAVEANQGAFITEETSDQEQAETK